MDHVVIIICFLRLRLLQVNKNDEVSGQGCTAIFLGQISKVSASV